MLAFREKLLSSEVDALKRKLSDYNFDETKSGNVVARRVGGHEHKVCPVFKHRVDASERTIATANILDVGDHRAVAE